VTRSKAEDIAAALKRLPGRARRQRRVFTLTTAVSLSCNARSDRKGPADQCPMLEVERKSPGSGAKSVFDPQRKWSNASPDSQPDLMAGTD
jgi:hypothetical protein